MKNILFIILTSAFLISVGCSADSKPAKIEIEKKQTVVQNNNEKKGTLLFFLNPNGMPCQMQDRILSSISGEISQKLNIQYVKTTDPEDRGFFYEYTIRALPSLVIVDNNYSETKRFTPGIIQQDEILKAIKEL